MKLAKIQMGIFRRHRLPQNPQFTNASSAQLALTICAGHADNGYFSQLRPVLKSAIF